MAEPLDIRAPQTPLPAPALANAQALAQKAGAAAPSGLQAQADRVAAEFEAMVLGQLLQPMFESLDSDGLFGGGSGERMFRPMLIEQYAKGLAAAGGLGLADGVKREILRLQAGAQTAEET